MPENNQIDLYAIDNWCDEQGLFSRKPGHHASRLYTDYSNSIEYFIESIRRATADDIIKYTEEVYSYLYVMAENDDGESIKTVYGLCPQLDEYWGSGGDGITPLGEAIIYKARKAICAFLEVGYGMESCCYGTGTYATDLTDDEDLVIFLIRHGAEVSFSTIVDLDFDINDLDLFSTALSCITSKEEFNQLLNKVAQVGDIIGSFNPNESAFGCMVKAIFEQNNVSLISYTIDWLVNNGCDCTSKYSDFLQFVAECIREACKHNRPDIIDLIHKYNFAYSQIRDNCYSFAYGWDYEYYHSSPLAFAVEADSYNCFILLLQWMHKENADINREGYHDDVSPSGNKKSIVEILKENGKELWIYN